MSGQTRFAATRFGPADRRRLESALSAAREARLRRRLEAVLLVAEGQTISETARRVRAARLSVRRWVERYLVAQDAATLADRPRRGRPRSAPRLTPRRLAAALARDPRRCGYRATTWTVPLLGHYLRRRHGVTVSARTLRRRHGVTVSARTLRRRLHEAGYRWKRPRYVYLGRAAHLAQKKGH